MKFKIKSDNNRIVKINLDSIQAYASRYKPGTEFEVEFVRRQKTVSGPMRRYYFAVVLPGLMRAVGYEPEEADAVHRQLKIVFFNVKPDAHGIYRDKDIPHVFANESKLKISEKIPFVEWVKRKAAENGEYIPDPGE